MTTWHAERRADRAAVAEQRRADEAQRCEQRRADEAAAAKLRRVEQERRSARRAPPGLRRPAGCGRTSWICCSCP
jgi:hypothetical protein